VIPAEIRERYQLTPGTQVEFVNEGDAIRLVVRRRVAPSDPAAGYGMIKVRPTRGHKAPRRLSLFVDLHRRGLEFAMRCTGHAAVAASGS
jgi:bifunctional DNA-binding transcriptional regulator/antitoxin component of YhaV-PrlF toxin-antitoxin module